MRAGTASRGRGLLTGGRLALLALFALVLGAGPAAADGLKDEEILDRAVKIVVRRVSPAVVRIDTLGDLKEGFQAPSSAAGKRGGVLARKGFKRAYGPSTGVVISPDGYILTSLFTLKYRPRHIIVSMQDGRQFVAKVAGKDESRGLALLKVEIDRALPVAPVGDKTKIKAGQICVALGRGLGGDTVNASVGIISAKDRISGKALQSSALISPANYGGVLAGLDGRVLGIIVPLDASGALAGVSLYDSGIGFAIPMSDVVNVLPRMIQGQTLKPGYVGIVADRTKTKGGITIKTVVSRSPADKAGLKVGDVIVAVDGRRLETYFEFFFALGAKVAGERVALKYLREGVQREVEVKLAPRPEKTEATPSAPGAKAPGGAPQPGEKRPAEKTPAEKPADETPEEESE